VANLAVMLYFFVFRHRTEHHGSRPVTEFVQKELDFTPDQTAKFRQLRDQHKQAIKPLMEDMKKLKDSLYSLLNGPQVNDSAVTSLTNKIGEKQKEWEVMIFHHLQKVRAICDSSQLPKFDTLVHHMINRGPWMARKRPQEK
ncbi:MAG TPA: periplasmic heavy metal sensor, partial [Chitinophagaceae bacterium]|nr:periplasmic heavy metal sensor [Chitinophagaceae bacterium]